jgi:hypothetical protein
MERILQRKLSGFTVGKVNNNTVVDVSTKTQTQQLPESRTKGQKVIRQNVTLIDDVKSQVDALSRIFSEKQKMNKELADKIEERHMQLEYALKQTQLEAEKVQILSSRQGFISFKTEILNADVTQFLFDVNKFEVNCNDFNGKYNSKLAEILELKETKEMVLATDKLNKQIVLKIEKILQQHLDTYNKLSIALQTMIEKKSIVIVNNRNIKTAIDEKNDRQLCIEQELTIHGQKLNDLKVSRDNEKLNFQVNKNKLQRLVDRQDSNKNIHDESINKSGLLIDNTRKIIVDLEKQLKDANVLYQEKLITQSKCLEKQSMMQESIVSYESSNKFLHDQVVSSSQTLKDAMNVKDSLSIMVEEMQKVLRTKITEVETAEARANTLEKELQDYYAQTINKMNLMKSLRQNEPKLYSILSEEIAKVRLQEVSLISSIDELSTKAIESHEYLEKMNIALSKSETKISALNEKVNKISDVNVKSENQIANARNDLISTAEIKRELVRYYSLLTAHYELSCKLDKLCVDCDQLKSKKVSLEQDITNFSTMTQSQKNTQVVIDTSKVTLPAQDMKQAQSEIEAFRAVCNRELRAESDSTRIVINNIENRKSSPSYLLREKKELEVIQDEVNRMIRSKQTSFETSDNSYGPAKSSIIATPFKKPLKTTLVVKATSPDYLFDEYSK